MAIDYTIAGSIIGAAALAGGTYLYKNKIKNLAKNTMATFGLFSLGETIVFAVRGTLTARYSNGGATGMGFGNTAPVSAADAGALSGNSIQWAATNNAKGVTWPGRSNTPNGRAISILCRFRPGYTGSPATQQGIFSLTTAAGKLINLEIAHTTAGNLIIQCKNELASLAFNNVIFGAWSPTSGTWYDIVFTWDGTTTANAATIYVDASSIGTGTAAAAFTASWTNQYFGEITFGEGNIGSTLNAGRIDEFVIWDSVIDPTSVTLDSGAGSLNGASRVSLVAVSAFNGTTYTDPGIANVKNGTTYTYAGSSLTGTYVVASTGSSAQICGPGSMWRN